MNICPAHLEFAKQLDKLHGREIAKNYLRKVLNPSYMSVRSLAAVKHAATSLEKALETETPSCPTEGWKAKMLSHITEKGEEILESNPHISVKELEKALTQTYCYGAKTDYPYRVWREQLKVYLAELKFTRLSQSLSDSYLVERY